MPTEQELQDKYNRMLTADLMDIATSKGNYTKMAVSVAKAELKQRKIPLKMIKDWEPPVDAGDVAWQKNCLFDLKFSQKLASYFLGMFTVIRPVRWFMRAFYSPGFRAEGYLLKAGQFNYYAIVGFIFLAIALSLGRYSGLLFCGIWAGGFLLAHLFDTGYNKRRQLDKLQEALDQGKLPFGY